MKTKVSAQNFLIFLQQEIRLRNNFSERKRDSVLEEYILKL